MKEVKEYCAGSPVAYWKVVSKNGDECYFKHELNANAFTVASGCSSLYEVLPVWEDICKKMPEKFMD